MPLKINVFVHPSVSDNRALHQASEQAKSDDVPLLVLFTISPQDYAAHDRSPRRVDFTLRNLRCLQVSCFALVQGLYSRMASRHPS